MAKGFNQKIKILYLMQMMWEQTDEDHVLNMQQILSQLEGRGIRAERKSIYDDFEVLRNFGLDVHFKKSSPSGYYLKERTFSAKDVEYVMSLLQQEKKDNEYAELLIEKMKKQLSIHQADIEFLPVEPESAEPEIKESENEDAKKEIQILFKGKHMDAVLAYGGYLEEPKEHKSGLYKVKMHTVVDEKFYGWMVSQGFGIKIVKPKAEAEAYRAHLKKLYKQYKEK